MKFETSAEKIQNIRRRETTSAADQGLLTQIVRLKQTTNQNQKLIKTLVKSMNLICDKLCSDFDIRGEKNKLK
jgi:hypothetical protein